LLQQKIEMLPTFNNLLVAEISFHTRSFTVT
jgi:hypothetical protein